ncbi:hypothetical protein GCM10027051_14630 [Niabella terrae]
MPVIIDYILKVNICLAIVYLFYQLFLRRLTFYNWNRWYLLGYTALSFIMPLINIMPSLEKRNIQQAPVIDWVPVLNFTTFTKEGFWTALSFWDWVSVVAASGALLLALRFAIRYWSYRRMKSRAQLISTDNISIYQLEEQMSPFSFGNAIFINVHLHQGEELEEVIRHEFVHVKQRHTIDIVWCELLCILNWFNPFVWLLKHNVRQNLEFIADDRLLQQGLDKKNYQYLLLKVMGNRQFAFTNHFNFSSLKKRIAMMNTLKTAQVHLLKFLFLLPVATVLLLSFRKRSEMQEQAFRTPAPASKSLGAVNSNPVTPHRGSDSEFFIAGDTTPAVTGAGISVQSDKTGKNTGTPKKKPLIIIDGNMQSPDFNLHEVDRDHIESIEVIKSSAAVDTYGERATNGVINITTKAFATKKVPGTKPLVILDGVEGADIESLSPDRISSVDVLKGSSATATYGDKGANGVIIVRTKNNVSAGSQPGSNLEAVTLKGVNARRSPHPGPVDGSEVKVIGVKIRPDSEKPPVERIKSQREVVVKGYAIQKERPVSGLKLRKNEVFNVDKKIYYVLNGQKATARQIKKLSPGSIKSIDVLKGESALKYYGNKAAHGAMIITTR